MVRQSPFDNALPPGLGEAGARTIEIRTGPVA